MENLILFLLLSIPLAVISRKTIFRPDKHGFYRFFGWECLLWLLTWNYQHWFENPFSLRQLISWFFLVISGILVLLAVFKLRKSGKQSINSRKDGSLYGFEKTSSLVDTGIYHLIRHPMYASLIYLSWGILLKNITPDLVLIAILSNLLFFLTALSDERECLEYFGESYGNYMKQTKRFIPWLF